MEEYRRLRPFKRQDPGLLGTCQEIYPQQQIDQKNINIQRGQNQKNESQKYRENKKITGFLINQENPQFKLEKVFQVSEPAGNLCLWIQACTETFAALLIVDPKRHKLTEAELVLQKSMKILAEKQADLQKVLDILSYLQTQYEQALKEKEVLQNQVDEVSTQLDRAQKLISGLSTEKMSWTNKFYENQQNIVKMAGDVLLSAGVVAYLGSFGMSYRDQCIVKWKQKLTEQSLPHKESFYLQDIMIDSNTLGKWVNQEKLPNDRISIENAIIYQQSRKFCLLIDPQLQAFMWLKKKYQDFVLIKQTMNQSDMIFIIESAIFNGQAVFLTDIYENIDPIFDDLFKKDILIGSQGNKMIRFQEKLTDMHPNFAFVLLSKMANPHYPPEVCLKLTLLNFMVTQEGLEDNLLNIVVKIEEPEKDEVKKNNIKSYFENKIQQILTEDKILGLLASSSGNLLENETLIEALKQSKLESVSIEEKLQQIQKQSEEFKLLQNYYKDVSRYSANLYFVVQDLPSIQSVYQFSLEFFIENYEKSIQNIVLGKQDKIKTIQNEIQYNLFQIVTSSLLQQHRLYFYKVGFSLQ